MDNKIKFKKCLIDSEKKIISILLYNNDAINIDVSSDKNNEDILQLIDMANVYYSAQIHKLNQSENYDSYGCLTSKVLGLDDIPITFINPKYVKNIFLQLLQLLFQDDESYLKYCQRDENSLEIPTSQNNISTLINDIVNICNNDDNNNIDNNNDEEDINIIDIKDVFIMILNYITSIQNNKIQKKLQKGKLQKQMNICGGIHNLHDIKNSLKDNINDTLIHTGKNIHKLIYEYKNVLYEGNVKNNVDYIKTCVDQNQDVCLYENTEITFKFMMETIQIIFNTLFVQILPQTSMLNCLYATLYQASVLNEMNILKHYSKTIQIPLLYRLIYSFFKDEQQQQRLIVSNDDNSNIYKLVNRLCNNEKNLDILCEIALKINIKDVEQINLLYWLLNERRGCTYEFYLIIIVNLYILGKCQNMNRNNKFSNGKTFAEPLYNLLLAFYGFVVNDLKDIKIALCSETLDQFSIIYSSEINKCLKLFVQNLQK